MIRAGKQETAKLLLTGGSGNRQDPTRLVDAPVEREFTKQHRVIHIASGDQT